MDRDEVAKLSQDLECFMIVGLSMACQAVDVEPPHSWPDGYVAKEILPPGQDAMKEVSRVAFAKFATPENALALVHVLGPEAILRWYFDKEGVTDEGGVRSTYDN